MEIEFSQQFF